MSTNEPMKEKQFVVREMTSIEKAIRILEVALTGYATKSKNTLIREAIGVLQEEN